MIHPARDESAALRGGLSALVGATIFVSPVEEPVHDGVVLIDGATIAAVGPRRELRLPDAARLVDCSGGAIVAGFWNSHVHFFERKWADAASIPASELRHQLQQMLTRYGFTSVFDTGSPWENTRLVRERIERSGVPGPSIRSTGEALMAPGATPSETVVRMMGAMIFAAPEVRDAAQAAAAARKLLEAGVDGIKVHLQPPPAPRPPLGESAIASAVNEAHRTGKPAFVHPNVGADIPIAVRAGVDVVAHTTPFSGAWDESILAAMKDRNVALTPTLTLWQSFLRHDRASRQQQVVDAAVAQLRDWVLRGGTVLFGTDLGVVDDGPRAEYELMAKAGMSFRQILASLTTAPAERFGEGARLGRVAAGYHADLVVLDGDPFHDIGALTAVRYTVRAGQIIYAAPTSAAKRPAGPLAIGPGYTAR